MHPLWLVAGWQAVVAYQTHAERQGKFNAAAALARQVSKPLLVAGGPMVGLMATAFGQPRHGYGDVCLDLDPSSCSGAPVVTVSDIRAIPYPDKYFGAAFASHILEHMATVTDAERAVAELWRVADGVFIAGPMRQSIGAWLHMDHHLWVRQRADGSIEMEQR